MKLISSYWLAIKEIILSFRIKLLRARLKANNNIYQNLPFADIEKNYEGRAANHQLSNWQTLTVESGSMYAYDETVSGHQKRRLIRELPRRLFLANNAYVYSAKGIVYNVYYNCVVMETLEAWGHDVNRSTEYIKITKTPTRTIEGLTFSLLSIGAVYNYAHFLFDGVSRLTLLKHLPKKPDWYLISGPATPWKEKILKHLCLEDKVIWMNEDEELSCEQLVFTNRINFSRHISPFAVRSIRGIFKIQQSSGKTPFRVIFASRRNAKDRKNKFEDLILHGLPSIVEVVDFETISLEDTIRICQECKFFFGVHGAAFSNLVFGNPGIKVVEFQIDEVLPEWHRNYYQTLYEQLNFVYRIEIISNEMSTPAFNELLNLILKDAQL